MKNRFTCPASKGFRILPALTLGFFLFLANAQDASTIPAKEAVSELDKALLEAKEGSSEARQRLAVRRVIRDAEQMIESKKDDPSRFHLLEFLFRAHRQMIALDDDPKNRQALMDTCRELVKAPDELADLKLEADLLLSQAELAKKGANEQARGEALRPLIDRYIDTTSGPKVLRMAMVLALELGDNKLVNDLQEMIALKFPADIEMIAFQRDKLGGQVIGAPFVGSFERSDGKTVSYPMDGLGHSTMLIFWSKEGDGLKTLKEISTAANQVKAEVAGRLNFVSINLDDLPDAGESIIRDLGLDWPVLRLPDGKKNPIFAAYVRSDSRLVTMSPSGYTALIMKGTGRARVQADGTVDYVGIFQSSLARDWTKPRYTSQLSSLMAGDFMVVDPEGGIDPTRPPELKAANAGQVGQPLNRAANSVPEETLKAIQECFVAPPLRYRLTRDQIRENYSKAIDLCRKAISEHKDAPDLWIVRNRLMVSLLGMWKTDFDLVHFEAAIKEAQIAIETGYPSGCDLIPRLCLSRQALRDGSADRKNFISKFVSDNGGDAAPGSVLAVACLLSLDVADRASFETYRKRILKDHTEYAMMWTFNAFLLDRYHSYWLFQVPFTAGWTYDRRQSYAMTKGASEEANRILRTELKSADGKTLKIPEDLDSQWTVIAFSQPGPWVKKREKQDIFLPDPSRMILSLEQFAATRPEKDVKIALATFGEDFNETRAGLDANKVSSPIFSVPDGINNPMVSRLGILSEDNEFNMVLISKEGRIVSALSGLNVINPTLENIIHREDEKAVSAALEKGDIESAKKLIFTLAPPYDPNAVDEKGRKKPKPKYSLAHLRARAKVYMALQQWDEALADADEVVQGQLGVDGGLSLRTDELDESEALKDTILQKIQGERK